MGFQESSTIAAISTPPGCGGIGIIRLSGADSLIYTRKLLKNGEQANFQPYLTSLRQLINPENGNLLDDALITYFRAPHSFTGEDVVEISTHGSPIVLSEILRLLVGFGAEIAQPGEFTMRAFLNRRMDLAQAEAVNDLIHATTLHQAQIAARQIHGELSKSLKPLKESLIQVIVQFESSVEFVEDDLQGIFLQEFNPILDRIENTLKQLISTYQYGKIIRSGVKLALVGQPNVGKSSLFNSLLGRSRAIVTNIPGTTRDTLSEVIVIKGIPIEVYDTAGIRETEDTIEKLGIERTASVIAEADYIAVMIESQVLPSVDDIAAITKIPLDILIINKSDLGSAIPDKLAKELARGKHVVRVSALTGEGIPLLLDCLYEEITSGISVNSDSGIITNQRHYSALLDTLSSLQKARQDISAGFTEEVILVHLHAALQSLGIITGETLISDILAQIFSTFCIGK